MKDLSRTMLTFLILTSAFHATTSLSAVAHTGENIRFFIGGLGYCGSRIASKLRNEFPSCTISGCVRSKTRKDEMMAMTSIADHNPLRLQVHVLDLDENYEGLGSDGISDFRQATHIIQTVAPIADFDQDPLLALHLPELQSSNNLQWVGYLSSTGVYGDYGGKWVDEQSELRCQDAKSLARVQAEIDWRKLESTRRQQSSYNNTKNTRIDCFRCGGIYGPGRGPLFSAPMSSSSSSSSSSEVEKLTPTKYVNRILVDDICGAIVAAIKANIDCEKSNYNEGGKIYNLVDDDPAPRRDVMAEARRLLGVGDGKTSTVSTQPDGKQSRRRATSRNTGNKRCRNQLLKEDYEWKQIAPTYREGMAYLLDAQNLVV